MIERQQKLKLVETQEQREKFEKKINSVRMSQETERKSILEACVD
jgi:hypothetical protein